MQERGNSIANALKLHLSCTNPSIWIHIYFLINTFPYDNTLRAACNSQILLKHGPIQLDIAYRLEFYPETKTHANHIMRQASTHPIPLWASYGVPITGPWFNIKISSYQYRKSHCGDKTVVRSFYLHNGISYTGKMWSLYWIRALVFRENWPYNHNGIAWDSTYLDLLSIIRHYLLVSPSQ